jgi:hypothetical protein
MKTKKKTKNYSNRAAPGRLWTARAKLQTHSKDGVDLTLIRWMLSLTPAERLQVLQRNVRSMLKLREKIRA